MADEGFVLQSAHRFDIDVEQANDIAEAEWARLGAGLSNFDPEWNEEIDQTAYLDGDGFNSSDITGAQLVITFEGHRKIGDEAQDFIVGLQLQLGEGRKTNFRWTAPGGKVYTGWVTVAAIKNGGGDANAKSDFSFEIHFNGAPVDGEPEPEAAGETGE